MNRKDVEGSDHDFSQHKAHHLHERTEENNKLPSKQSSMKQDTTPEIQSPLSLRKNIEFMRGKDQSQFEKCTHSDIRVIWVARNFPANRGNQGVQL